MEYCFMCDNTGIYLKPDDEECYDKAFDRYDHMGIFNLEETRINALRDAGYTQITPCPHCHKSPNDYKK